MTQPEPSRDEHGRDAAGEREQSQPPLLDRSGGGSTTPPALEREAARRARHRRAVPGRDSGPPPPETDERPEGAELLDYEPEPEEGEPETVDGADRP